MDNKRYAYCPECEVIHDLEGCEDGAIIQCRPCGCILMVYYSWLDESIQLRLVQKN